MNKWITVNPLEFSRDEKFTADGGVRVEVHLSPYDVPRAVRGYYDDAGGTFHIDFQYISPDEILKKVEGEEGIELSVGRRSKRLYCINLDTDRSQTKSVKERVLGLLSGLSKEEPRENHLAAKKIIEGMRTQIFPEAAQART